jgi:hypothetical protein
MTSRRNLLKTIVALSPGIIFPGYSILKSPSKLKNDLIPECLTPGQGFHWFGYYDKLQTDPSGRYILAMKTSFEMRPPEADDVIEIGIIDLRHNNRWKSIGKSRAWGWQQGCMLQWIPGSEDEIIWNDRENESFISHIYNVRTGKARKLPKPVYALNPDGTMAIGTEFSRIQNLRPGYGYAGLPDKYENIKAPEEIGLYRMNLKNGHHNLLFSLADMAAIPHQGSSVEDNLHWFNHLLVNTDGSRFTFLHRWRPVRMERQKMATGGFVTRMFTASTDGKDPFIIDPSGYTSHFIWSDPRHICAWTRPSGEKDGFYLLEDHTANYIPTGKGIMTMNGHNTYVPGTDNEWILCDTYPQSSERMQELYLFHVPSSRKVQIGKFHEPKEYAGEWRCDLHPKCTPDGKKVIFDSTHEGKGRQIYMIDISSVIS